MKLNRRKCDKIKKNLTINVKMWLCYLLEIEI